MGPSILLDKSAIQSMGKGPIRELSRYFYTVIPPVLLMEILADLSLDPKEVASPGKRVASVARKLLPPSSIVNLSYQFLCVADLLGEAIETGRRPVVGGGRPIVAKDGSRGIVGGVQPENEALIRWHRGDFNETDLAVATDWRKNAQAIDLEKTKHDLPKPPAHIRTLDSLADFVDDMLSRSDAQAPMLDWFLRLLNLKDYLCKWIYHRWRSSDNNAIRTFAPYAFHCLKVHAMFYIGMSHGLVGTRATNVIDIQYLCYAPFAYVFCSGDDIHRQLAPRVLGKDQTFVPSEEMRSALSALAVARETDPKIEPGDDSLVHQLWIRHWGKFSPQASRPAVSAERAKEIMDKVGPIMEAIRESERNREPPPRWPR